jgi:Domain of unknown function (DUF4340)
MNKVYVLLGVLVVLVVVAVVVNYDPSGRGRDRAPAVENQTAAKLPAIDQNRIHAIELSDAENRVRVARSGENWVLPEKFDSPAMANKVTELLQGLQGLERAERISKSAASAREKILGLEPDVAKRIKLFDENNKPIVDLWVGKIDVSGDRNLQQAGTFVRVEGQDAVYSHGKRLQHLVMPQLSMWLDSRVFVLDPKQLEESVAKAERVTIEFDDVPFTPGTPDTRPDSGPAARVRLVAEGKEPESRPDSEPAADIGPKAAPTPPQKPRVQRDWTIVEPAESALKPQAAMVEDVVRGLIYVRADDVVGSDPTLKEYGLEHPFVEVEARFADGGTRRLRVGKQAPAPTEPSRKGGTYRYAHADGVSRVFLINEFVVARLRKKPDELKGPDAPRGAPGGQPAPIELPK